MCTIASSCFGTGEMGGEGGQTRAGGGHPTLNRPPIHPVDPPWGGGVKRPPPPRNVRGPREGVRGMVRGVCRSQRANKLQRKDEKRASQEVTAVARETTKGEGRWVRPTRHARAPTPRHTRRALTKGSQRDTHTRGGRRPHTALAEKKKGGGTRTRTASHQRVAAATGRQTGTPHTNMHEPPKEKKREKEEKKNTPPTHTDTLRHIQAKQRKGTSQCQAERPDAHGRRTQKRDAAGGDEKKKRKKKRGREGRRRPPLLPPPHAAAVPAVSSRCLHPLYNAAAGGLTNRRPTSRHTSAASAARRSRQ